MAIETDTQTDDDDAPQISLQEMLDELTIQDDGDGADAPMEG